MLPASTAVLHVTVSYLILKVVTMTAICKRSFGMCGSFFFSGIPLVLHGSVLNEHFGAREMLSS